MATRHPRMSFRDRVTTALFGDIYTRDLEFDAKVIAEIERLKAIERRAQNLADLLLDEQSRETARVILEGPSG